MDLCTFFRGKGQHKRCDYYTDITSQASHITGEGDNWAHVPVIRGKTNSSRASPGH